MDFVLSVIALIAITVVTLWWPPAKVLWTACVRVVSGFWERIVRVADDVMSKIALRR